MTLATSVIRFGSTPLHQAAYFGHCDCALVLLAAGALVNVEEAWGQTPLFLAAQRAHRFVVLRDWAEVIYMYMMLQRRVTR